MNSTNSSNIWNPISCGRNRKWRSTTKRRWRGSTAWRRKSSIWSWRKKNKLQPSSNIDLPITVVFNPLTKLLYFCLRYQLIDTFQPIQQKLPILTNQHFHYISFSISNLLRISKILYYWTLVDPHFFSPPCTLPWWSSWFEQFIGSSNFEELKFLIRISGRVWTSNILPGWELGSVVRIFIHKIVEVDARCIWMLAS